MECPRCKDCQLSVIDSRDYDGSTIRRRRACQNCGYRFTTFERIEPVKLQVQKRNGVIEPYSREKLLRGLILATEKRPISAETLEAIADRVETKLIMDYNEPVPTKKIGNFIIRELRALDEVAYLRFASVYRNFENLSAFEKELSKMKSR